MTRERPISRCHEDLDTEGAALQKRPKIKIKTLVTRMTRSKAFTLALLVCKVEAWGPSSQSNCGSWRLKGHFPSSTEFSAERSRQQGSDYSNVYLKPQYSAFSLLKLNSEFCIKSTRGPAKYNEVIQIRHNILTTDMESDVLEAGVQFFTNLGQAVMER